MAPVIVQEGDDENVLSCGGCHMSVTQNCYVLLRGRSEGLITCPNCSRILYVEEP
jgi:predicted  nucleic acid-binding Zn-ribbon protein